MFAQLVMCAIVVVFILICFIAWRFLIPIVKKKFFDVDESKKFYKEVEDSIWYNSSSRSSQWSTAYGKGIEFAMERSCRKMRREQIIIEAQLNFALANQPGFMTGVKHYLKHGRSFHL